LFIYFSSLLIYSIGFFFAFIITLFL
jgi:hypothetical protein